MKYVKAEIIKRTFLAGLMAALSPLAWLQVGKIIDNPRMNARQLAIKAGRVSRVLAAIASVLIPLRLLGSYLLPEFSANTQRHCRRIHQDHL
jgi:hypothetical protein